MTVKRVVKRPGGPLNKWTSSQASRYIKAELKNNGMWLCISSHAFERMDERKYSVEDVYETIGKGQAISWEPGPVSNKEPDHRMTFEYKRKTSISKVVVSLSEATAGNGVLVTVLSKKEIIR